MTIPEFWQSYNIVDYGLAIGPCWIWAKASRNGYGAVSMNGKVEDTHRVSYRLTHGDIPLGLSILHHCDQGRCIRPEHLFSGTQADNMHDMKMKDRDNRVGQQGSAHHKAKLTEQDVLDIRMAYSGLVRVNFLAAKYGLNRNTITRIATHKAWKHVKEAL